MHHLFIKLYWNVFDCVMTENIKTSVTQSCK